LTIPILDDGAVEGLEAFSISLSSPGGGAGLGATRNATIFVFDVAQISDCFISTGSPKEVCPLGLTPTTSTTIFTVIGDALVVMMMEKIGFSKEEYSKRHHGGYLGFKSRENIVQPK
jgi:hypothetical protein